VLGVQDRALLLPRLGRAYASATLRATGEKVEMIEARDGTVFVLPSSANDPVDNIVVVKMM